MTLIKKILVIITILSLTTSCSDPNVLTEFSQQESDEAFFMEAKKKINRMEWTAALDILENKISSGFQQQLKVKEARAGAYAGRCGFTFADILGNIQNTPSAEIFPFFMSIFAGTTVIPGACDSAIAIMTSLGDVTERTNDQNLFISILGMARIGTILQSKLDGPVADGIPDGAYGTDYNVCHNYSGGSATDGWPALPFPLPAMPAPEAEPATGRTLSDDDVKKVASGIGLIFENISALGAAMSGANSTLDSLEDALTMCEDLPGSPDCIVTDTALVSAELLYATRILLSDSSMGFGVCTAGAFPNPPTPPFPASLCCPGLYAPGVGL